MAGSAAAENWPQWRGPGGQGVSSEQRLPTDWGPERNLVWKVPFPAGHSSPVVWGDRIFLTAAYRRRRAPRCPRRGPHDGRGSRGSIRTASPPIASTRSRCWRSTRRPERRYGSRSRTKARSTTRGIARSSFAGPTAATDGPDGLRVLGPEGLYAYDVSGKLLWKVIEKFPTLGLGMGPRRCCMGNLVIIQRDEDNGERAGNRRVRQAHRQGGLAHPAQRADHLVDAGAGRGRRPHRARDQRRRVRHSLRSGGRQGAVAGQGRRRRTRFTRRSSATAW